MKSATSRLKFLDKAKPYLEFDVGWTEEEGPIGEQLWAAFLSCRQGGNVHAAKTSFEICIRPMQSHGFSVVLEPLLCVVLAVQTHLKSAPKETGKGIRPTYKFELLLL